MKKESPLKRVWRMAESQHSKLKLSVFLAVLGVGAGFIPYYCSARLIILLLGQSSSNPVTMGDCIPYLAFALLGAIAKVFLSCKSTAISHKSTFAVLAEIRQSCVKKLSNLSMGTLQAQPVGHLKNILVDQIESLEVTLAHILPDMTANILMPIVLLIALFIIDWRLALISMITMPLGMCFMMATMKDYPVKFKEAMEIGKKMNDSIVEYVNGIEVIKAFNQGSEAYKGYADAVNANAAFYYGWMKSTQKMMACYRNIFPAVLAGVLPAGLAFYINGSITTSDFIMVMILSMGIVGPIITATNYTDSLAQAGSIIETVESVLNAKEQHHPVKETLLEGTDIELNHVSFAYEEENGEVLDDISLTIKQGTVNALVGPSGSGKSTISKLIAGFWDIEKGSIRLGGQELKEIPLWQIADNIAYVAQNNFLFDDTIRENIRMGRPGATDEEVEQVAKSAGCDAFIRRLEQGYDTNVGGGGAHLSGGERQRIAIARAMLKNAPIVILDEATAYIDPENEAILQNAISKLVKGKTLIMIAHRLSTITDADQIIVVDHGKVNATGTHEDLLKTSELYQEMWEAHIGAKESEVA
ncbi:MAG: ABC transporter ATP-binding protein [bacterium]|nr:ABC transporter ATP-binding protein [bacterium]